MGRGRRCGDLSDHRLWYGDVGGCDARQALHHRRVPFHQGPTPHWCPRRTSQHSRFLGTPCPRDGHQQLIDGGACLWRGSFQLLQEFRRPARADTDGLLERAHDETVPADAQSLGATVDGLQQRSRDVHGTDPVPVTINTAGASQLSFALLLVRASGVQLTLAPDPTLNVPADRLGTMMLRKAPAPQSVPVRLRTEPERKAPRPFEVAVYDWPFTVHVKPSVWPGEVGVWRHLPRRRR